MNPTPEASLRLSDGSVPHIGMRVADELGQFANVQFWISAQHSRSKQPRVYVRYGNHDCNIIKRPETLTPAPLCK